MELLVPSTFGADERDMKIRAVKYGILARTASIFGAERITIYEDPDEKLDTRRSAEIIEKYLNYAETPPYMRKKLIPFDEDLKYANILPALQIDSHGYSDRFREAVITGVEEGVAEAEAGLENPVTVYGDFEEDQRVTLKMIGDGNAKVIDSSELDRYWTFKVVNDSRNLEEVLEEREGSIIGTSAHGEDYRDYGISSEEIEEGHIVFGSAWRGIPSMAKRGNVSMESFDYMLNFVPEQNTRTVRTEEALMICLSRLL